MFDYGSCVADTWKTGIMGVRGLKSYIEGNILFLKDCNFKGSTIIIDGCNLFNILYDGSKYDLKHGGDYYAFEILIKNFFKALKNCNIEPYVILDGGSDHTDKKLETLKQRAQDHIQIAKDLSLGRIRYSSDHKPVLLKSVFKQILIHLKITFVHCMGEADWDIAALANQLDCPVLSDDSDFFIFDLKAGVLPITHFQWEKGLTEKFIPAKIFLVSNFCKCFKNMNEQLLPLLAALAGNDYVNIHIRNRSFSWEKFSSCSAPFSRSQARLDGILHWLSGFQNTKEAIGAVLDLLGDQKYRDPVQKDLTVCQNEYQLTKHPHQLAQFLLNNVALSRLPLELELVLPRWIRMPLSEGKMSFIVTEPLDLQRAHLSHHVESFDLPSSNAISRPIRQVLYGLLKQRDDRKPSVARVDPGECYVEEHDREGLSLSTFWVKAACPASGKNLHLETLNKKPLKLRRQVLYDTLGVTSIISTSIAAKFQLPVYVTCYWLSKADPQPHIEHLWSLLLGFVFGELTGRYMGQEGIALVWNRLNSLRLSPTIGGPDLEAAHTYSQWQGCMKDSYRLNQLLCLPLPEPELSRLYCGPLVHQAALRLRKGVTPESWLRAGPIAMQLFRDLKDAVLDSLDTDVRARLQKASRRDHPTERPARSVGNVEELTTQLFEQEDEDEDYGVRSGKAKTENEDDEIYRDACRIRTRHKKKSRALRTHSPVQLKKRERVSWA
ncbi:protein asteroid homolog 1-like [Clupea harengus]|uniref:Protein asteroid homolog 1-like n=1 Tax=Clupea harengus TaxID=7950 RepID=A0A6P8GB93_CLUHA|nr:protein asteroid homolog 1-like [Clupea harengus]